MEAKSPNRTCPKCNKGVLETRVKRPLFIKLTLGWTDVKRYRCLACNKKSYVWRNTPFTKKEEEQQ